MSDRDLLAALDACRLGESTLDDPALVDAARRLATDASARQLQSRVRDADRRLHAALHDVQPPAGLADRVLARLAAQAGQADADNTDVRVTDTDDAVRPAAPSPAATPPSTDRGPTRWRRRAFLGGGVAAVAAAVMLAIQFWPEPPQPWSAEQVLDAAIALYARVDRTTGHPLAEAPSSYPPSRDLVELPPHSRWRRVDDALAGGDAVVYDIELAPRGPRAMLAVVSPGAAVTGLPDYPPPQPATPTTQGVCAAAWQEGDLVYVLVVEGGPREYERFLRTNRGPFAILHGGNRCICTANQQPTARYHTAVEHLRRRGAIG